MKFAATVLSEIFNYCCLLTISTKLNLQVVFINSADLSMISNCNRMNLLANITRLIISTPYQMAELILIQITISGAIEESGAEYPYSKIYLESGACTNLILKIGFWWPINSDFYTLQELPPVYGKHNYCHVSDLASFMDSLCFETVTVCSIFFEIVTCISKWLIGERFGQSSV